MNIFIPTADTPGGDIFVENNPPPNLDTVSSFFLKHFLILLSEENMPITSVIAYVKEIAFENTELFIDIIMASYGYYRKELNKQMRKETNG